MPRRDMSLDARTPAAISDSARITAADVARAKETIAKDGAGRAKQLLRVPKVDAEPKA